MRGHLHPIRKRKESGRVKRTESGRVRRREWKGEEEGVEGRGGGSGRVRRRE